MAAVRCRYCKTFTAYGICARCRLGMEMPVIASTHGPTMQMTDQEVSERLEKGRVA